MNKIFSLEETYELFDNFLNSTHGFVLVAGKGYSPAKILEKIDEERYDKLYWQFLDQQGFIYNPDSDAMEFIKVSNEVKE